MTATIESLQIKERITARVSRENRELIEQAAQLSGATNLNSFFTHVIVNEAKRIVAEHQALKLSNDDAVAFVTALDAPVEVDNNLLKAAGRYKELVKGEDRKTR
jgi:uncharacterized protein (DUF1778 family)